jgi:hypothetical protein
MEDIYKAGEEMWYNFFFRCIVFHISSSPPWCVQEDFIHSCAAEQNGVTWRRHSLGLNYRGVALVSLGLKQEKIYCADINSEASL